MHNDPLICTRCVMDESAGNITFDSDGVCNFCSEFLSRAKVVLTRSTEERNQLLNALVADVKRQGKNRKYDCIIGVSGGVDSSWVLVQAVQLGLRPLAVHMDNGWNTELAQNNINNLVTKLGVDLFTYVIDWEEYRTLTRAFLDSDVIDVELLYDNAMLAVNYNQARKYGVKYILAGTNQATEGMIIPPTWTWFKFDKKNIKAIARKFGGIALKSFPAFGTIDFTVAKYGRGIRWVHFLDNTDYNKEDALTVLERAYGYKRYAYKHYESVLTRFYQGHILPEKFSVDKRKVHLSTLIVTGQMTRDEAVENLKGTPYPTGAELEADTKYFLKKVKWEPQDLADYLARLRIEHTVYGSEKPLWDFLYSIFSKLRALRSRK